MIAFPNAKINLGLNVVEKRPDGYHNIETVFYPIQWKDTLEIIPNTKETSCQIYGLTIDTPSSNNLCVKAWKLLQDNYPIPAVDIHLLKNIPMGAGLGGGSSDAAFTLNLLNQHFQLNISQQKLMEFAAQLGSDCAFFIQNTPCFAAGRGDILEPISINLSGYKIVVVHPGIHISTPWAFQQIKPQKTAFRLTEMVHLPIEDWKTNIFNQFEIPVFEKYPLIASIKSELYQQGAIYASMSGSGSACFGIFSQSSKINLSPFDSYKTHITVIQ